MAQLYSNENFPLAVVRELRRLGHDVLTIQETGRAGQRVPDPEVLHFAQIENRALITYNRKDFKRLHQTTPNHAGIIICTVDSDFIALAQRIHEAIVSQSTLSGRLVRVIRPQSP